MRDIALIVLDTLRHDYSNILDSVFQKHGLRKYLGISTSPWTLPSHMSFFTGLVPSEHRVFERYYKGVINFYVDLWSYDSIFKVLKSEGYTLHFYTANPLLTPSFGFTGMDVYREYPYSKYNWFLKSLFSPREQRVLLSSRPFREKIRLILGENGLTTAFKYFLLTLVARTIFPVGFSFEKGSSLFVQHLQNAEISSPTFMFVNLMECHDPYAPQDFHKRKAQLVPEVNPALAKEWKRNYPRACTYLRKNLSSIISILNRKLKDPLILVISDHGQLLGEYNGLIGHEIWLYDELVHVPIWSNEKLGSTLSLVEIPEIILNKLGWEEESSKTEVFFSESYGSQRKNSKEDMWRIAAEDSHGNKVIYNVDRNSVEFQRGDSKELVTYAEEYAQDPTQYSKRVW